MAETNQIEEGFQGKRKTMIIALEEFRKDVSETETGSQLKIKEEAHGHLSEKNALFQEVVGSCGQTE